MIHLFKTDDAWSGLVVRLMLGLVMFPHGAQKLLGWYGGFGFTGTIGFFHGENGTSNDLVNKQPREGALVRRPRSYLKEER